MKGPADKNYLVVKLVRCFLVERTYLVMKAKEGDEDVDEVDQDAVEDIENRDGPPTMWESSELIFVS